MLDISQHQFQGMGAAVSGDAIWSTKKISYGALEMVYYLPGLIPSMSCLGQFSDLASFNRGLGHVVK